MQEKLFDDGCKHGETIEEPLCNEETGEVYKIKVSCKLCGAWIKWKKFVPDDFFIMPYGKYAGKKLVDIIDCDKEYAIWLSGNSGRNIAGRIDRLLCRP